MVLELLIAAAVTAGSLEPPREVPLRGALPHGGRACLIVERCDPRACVMPVQRARPPLPPPRRCAKRHPMPRPRAIPAATG